MEAILVMMVVVLAPVAVALLILNHHRQHRWEGTEKLRPEDLGKGRPHPGGGWLKPLYVRNFDPRTMTSKTMVEEIRIPPPITPAWFDSDIDSSELSPEKYFALVRVAGYYYPAGGPFDTLDQAKDSELRVVLGYSNNIDSISSIDFVHILERGNHEKVCVLPPGNYYITYEDYAGRIFTFQPKGKISNG